MCKWYEINIEPRDVLFFKGGRPMQASVIGEGAQWPVPSVFHQAMLSGFHHRWPENSTCHHLREGETKNTSSFLYGDLQTVGVFPAEAKTTYFPMPADVQCADKSGSRLCILQPGKLSGKSDLPQPLTMGLFKPEAAEATKAKPAQWISGEDLQKYLEGRTEIKQEPPEFFHTESRPGIGIDPDSGTTEDGKFYLAEYLRLADGISLKGFAAGETVAEYFRDRQKSELIFGGQRGIVFLDGTRDDEKLPEFGERSAGTRIKWVLLTPAIFTSGWLPSWVDSSSGAIRGFNTVKPQRQSRESRADWRARFEKSPVAGRLVAACIPKPIAYSGWKAHYGTVGPRPTRLCVPAGAVYYFETDSEEQTEQLLEFLDGKRKSDMAAEKGFGFGVCGTWTEYKQN